MNTYEAIIKEVENVLLSVDMQEVKALKREILGACKVYIAGAGRSGFVAGCFAMRLAQLGICACLTGEATATAITDRDILILISGSGNTGSIVRFSERAREEGAKVAIITITGEGKAADGSSLIIKMPGACDKETDTGTAGEEGSRQPMGTLFEQSVLLLLDGLVLELMDELQETSQTMLRRHANLE